MNTSIDQMHYLVLQIGEAHCQGDWNYRQVCSPFTRIYYVTQGQAQVELPDRVQELRPGYLYIVPAFTPHSCICSGAFSHYYIHIYNESDDDLFGDWLLPVEIEADERVAGEVKRLCELCPGMSLRQYEPESYDNSQTLRESTWVNKQRKMADRIESRAIVYQLLARFVRQAQPHPAVRDVRIVEVLHYIHAHLADKMTMAELAEQACLSKDHLIRLFRKEMHTTPLCYINRKRIEKAQLKLLTETTPIKEIAYQLGFEGQAYFNRVFKQVAGVSPATYRELGLLGDRG